MCGVKGGAPAGIMGESETGRGRARDRPAQSGRVQQRWAVQTACHRGLTGEPRGRQT